MKRLNLMTLGAAIVYVAVLYAYAVPGNLGGDYGAGLHAAETILVGGVFLLLGSIICGYLLSDGNRYKQAVLSFLISLAVLISLPVIVTLLFPFR